MVSVRGKQVDRWRWEDQHQKARQTSILRVFVMFKR